MQGRQSLPEQWLITDPRISESLLMLIRRLPRGSGIVLRQGAHLSPQLRLIARSRGLTMINEERGEAGRVHNPAEIRRARLRGTRLLLLSPMFATRSHPDWAPIPRMRAAALVRLAGKPLLALGGMNATRYAKVGGLGFDGWAAIDAWTRR
jgi:thiamine-phosphate pyrophosphorylase